MYARIVGPIAACLGTSSRRDALKMTGVFLDNFGEVLQLIDKYEIQTNSKFDSRCDVVDRLGMKENKWCLNYWVTRPT